jgi:hypothetical protein
MPSSYGVLDGETVTVTTCGDKVVTLTTAAGVAYVEVVADAVNLIEAGLRPLTIVVA